MKVFLFLVCFLLFIAACSDNNSAKMTSIQNTAVDNQNSNVPSIVNVKRDVHNQNAPANTENTEITASNTRSLKTFDCDNSNKYSFVVVENPNRKNETEPLMPKDLNIVTGKEVIAKVELPIPDSEAKNFSLNSVEKTRKGFEIKAEWGGGLYHYEIQFNFICKENNFYLYRVKNENFSTKNLNSKNLWDKKETKVTKIEPNLLIEKFVMLDYLQ